MALAVAGMARVALIHRATLLWLARRLLKTTAYRRFP
jgi:hypothetical protein